MKIILAYICILAALKSFPSDNTTAKARRIDKVGGYVSKPNSMKGRIVFYNCQDSYSTNCINEIITKFWSYKDGHLNFIVENGEKQAKGYSLEYWAQLKKVLKADVLIGIIDEKTYPQILSAPENYWTVINVKHIADGLDPIQSQTKCDARYRKELIRALAFATSSASTQFPNNIISLGSVSEFDKVEAFMPADSFNIMLRRLKKLGVAPEYVTSYLNACEEGWAPEPTTDIQKKIWEKCKQKADDEADPTNRWKRDFEKK